MCIVKNKSFSISSVQKFQWKTNIVQNNKFWKTSVLSNIYASTVTIKTINSSFVLNSWTLSVDLWKSDSGRDEMRNLADILHQSSAFLVVFPPKFFSSKFCSSIRQGLSLGIFSRWILFAWIELWNMEGYSKAWSLGVR